jgi:hypothetical protein
VSFPGAIQRDKRGHAPSLVLENSATGGQSPKVRFGFCHDLDEVGIRDYNHLQAPQRSPVVRSINEIAELLTVGGKASHAV